MRRWSGVNWKSVVVLAAAALAVALPLGMAGAQDGSGLSLSLEPVVTGLDAPVFATHAGDHSGRQFIVERAGRIRVVIDGELRAEPFLDITERVQTDGSEQGMLGLAFHPGYADNGLFYVFYTAKNWNNTVSRFNLSSDPNRADPASEIKLFDLPDREANHNGGMLTFGPGYYLYIGTGDEGGAGDPFDNAQDLGSLFGKILRVDVNSGDPYGIPADNPFVDVPGARPEIWAYGLRNPWRFSFDWRDHLMDPHSGGLYLGDVGQALWEEVNVGLPSHTGGMNFGWPIMEGRHCYPAETECPVEGLHLPEAEYGHDLGCSVTGGYAYRGSESLALTGIYLFADYCSGRIWSIQAFGEGEQTPVELLDTELTISSFAVDQQGEMYVVDLGGGAVYKISATGDIPAPFVETVLPDYIVPDIQDVGFNVYGEFFTPQSVMLWDGEPLPTEFVGGRLLFAHLRLFGVIDPGVHTVTVLNPGPGGGLSQAFEVVVDPPAIVDDAFRQVWSRTDQPVVDGAVSRTWVWGPHPFTTSMVEPYVEGLGGSRQVQYFDKSRMEITNVDADPASGWFVTNGLLVAELVDGRVQTGDNQFSESEPATVNVAGDGDDPSGPTYATFGPLRDDPALADGAAITWRLARDGSVTDDPGLAARGVTAAYRVQVPGIDHQVASVFREFITSTGLVHEDGQIVTAPLFENPFYATGYPIAEAYWANVKVGGTYRDVLMQCFERRCLTYTPDNPEGWQVEAGNVGRHYFEWRYRDGAGL